AGQDYVEIAKRIAAYTGGIGAAAQVQPLAGREDYLQSFMVSGKALDRNAQQFIDLLIDLTAHLEIEAGRLKEIIAETATRLESSIAGLGFQFAILLAQSKLSSEGALNDRLQGIGMLHVMRDLAKLDDPGLSELSSNLDKIRTKLFRSDSLTFVVTCEDSMIDTLKTHLKDFVSALPTNGDAGKSNGAPTRPDPLDSVREARTAPLPVAFNVRTFKTVRYQHPDAPILLVLANYMRDTFLHKELREKGGAYGAYAQANTGAGSFYLGSYRDPNIIRTYDTYDRAVRWVTDNEIDQEALKEAILGACGDVDPLESPDIKGRREAINRLTGFTRSEREKFKQRLLSATAADLQRVAKAYLDVPKPIQATVAGADLIEAARKERPDLFEVVAPV
ncbi:MAG: presequence protease, partial [Chloroflexota bacterium]|nr:presequence protease [Chloroflexota bacterium]